VYIPSPSSPLSLVQLTPHCVPIKILALFNYLHRNEGDILGETYNRHSSNISRGVLGDLLAL